MATATSVGVNFFLVASSGASSTCADAAVSGSFQLLTSRRQDPGSSISRADPASIHTFTSALVIDEPG
jgi:hypothetical protein